MIRAEFSLFGFVYPDAPFPDTHSCGVLLRIDSSYLLAYAEPFYRGIRRCTTALWRSRWEHDQLLHHQSQGFMMTSHLGHGYTNTWIHG
jgi:hypothetical protein